MYRSMLSALPISLALFLCSASAVLAADVAAVEGVRVEILTPPPAPCGRPTKAGDTIEVDYRGRLESTGEEFDNSYKAGAPLKFRLGASQVIKGWDISLLDMCPGEERRLTIPPELAYGNRALKGIPAGSTLVFDSALKNIVNIDQSEYPAPAPVPSSSSISTTAQPTSLQSTAVSSTTLSSAVSRSLTSHTTIAATTASKTEEEALLTIATAPAKASQDETEDNEHDSKVQPVHEAEHEHKSQAEHGIKPTPMPTSAPTNPLDDDTGETKQRCRLLGPFALLVQFLLGGAALLTLVWKRFRESPQRPWKIWFFDVSKQVFGSMLTHVLNIGMSMISSVKLANHAEHFANQVADAGPRPDGCSYYLLNLLIDTTLGIPVLWILLLVIHALFLRTPLARPPQSLKSGNYGEPPKWAWYLKQLTIYFIGLTGMKFCVFLLFSALPWLPWLGDWMLRWTQFDERLEIAFSLCIFPLFLNAIQYWVIDSLIMDKKRDKTGYQAVEEGEDEETRLVDEHTLHDDEIDEDERFKIDEEVGPLKETDPVPIDRPHDGSSSVESRSSTLRGLENDIPKKSV